MAEFLINGTANLSGSRIIVPVMIATVLPGVTVQVYGTVTANVAGATLSVGNIAISTISSPVLVTGTVSTGPQAAIATVGTLQAQANLAVASLVGSVGSPVAIGGGTIGTIQSGIVNVGSVFGTVVPIESVGTVGAIASDVLYPAVSLQQVTLGIASVVVPSMANFGLPGQVNTRRLFMMSAAAFGAAGTLTVFNAGAQFAQIIVPANDTRFWEIERGYAFTNAGATLYASLAGTMSCFFYMG